MHAAPNAEKQLAAAALGGHIDASAMSGSIDVTSYGTLTSGYDAIDGSSRRRQPISRTSSEDAIADARKRQMLTGTASDIARNFIVAKWLVRKHLDYVSTFEFQAKTTDRGYNAYLEQWWADRTTAETFDVAGRHPHRRFVRISEAQRVLAGDMGWLKLAMRPGHPDRGKVQAIEGDRITLGRGETPRGTRPEDWVNGVLVDQNTGKALKYALSKRVAKTRLEFDRMEDASNLILHACYEFRFDQVRGVSPIAAGLNWMRDTYEAFDHSNAKLKLAQLLGVSIYSSTQDNIWARGDDGYEIDFSNRGPFILELEQGDKAEILESKTHGAETNNYLRMLILICLKALDIPFSFWDESFTNFYGSRGGLIQYQKSSKDRICDLRDLQYKHADWRFAIGVADGDLELPSGKGLSFLTNGYDFIPAGVPWWDPTKEVRGAAMAIACGLSSPQKACRESNTDFEQNILEIKQAMEFAEANGVPLTFADSSAFVPEISVGGNVDA